MIMDQNSLLINLKRVSVGTRRFSIYKIFQVQCKCRNINIVKKRLGIHN